MYASPAGKTGQGPRQVQRFQLGDGDLGSYQTLAAMRQVVLGAQSSPIVVETAGDIIRRAPPRDKPAQIAAVRAWLSRHFQFVNDPTATELLRTPEYMLARMHAVGVIQGDCDDASILAAALCSAIGIRSRFVAVGFEAMPGPLLHVFAEAFDGKAWREMDVTRPVGVPLAAINRREVLEV